MSDITPSDKARADRLARSMQSLTDAAIVEIADYLDAMQAQPELRAITWELLARKALAKIKELKT
jgi:hypothetical protein